MIELDAEIEELEDDITVAIKLAEEDGYFQAPTLELWTAACAAWSKSLKAEDTFIECADFQQHSFWSEQYGARPLSLSLRRQRLDYLRRLTSLHEIKRTASLMEEAKN